jgi:hypothetical protein
MTDENKSYRVTDRRHFNRDGESVATEAGDAEHEAPAVDVDALPLSGGAEPPADLIALVVSLGTQAGMLLGGAEGVPPDLKGARWLISILEMLKDKTEGRRTAEETEALETLLYELRMAYVQRTRTGGV